MSEKLERAMGNVEAKVDILLERTANFDKRISSVEKRVWWASGASAVIAYIATNILGRH